MAIDVDIDVDLLKSEIKKTYACVSDEPASEFIFPTGRSWAADLDYPPELAHVPDINDFVAGFTTLLKPEGVATFEFPDLLTLVSATLFDTMYHEHFSYLSLMTVDRPVHSRLRPGRTRRDD